MFIKYVLSLIILIISMSSYINISNDLLSITKLDIIDSFNVQNLELLISQVKYY